MANPAPADPSLAPARRGRGRPPKNPVAAAGAGAGAETPAAVGEYEREREARIRENMERMQKLGILDLAQTLNQSARLGRGRPRKDKPASPSPSRRSLRLFGLRNTRD